MSRYLTGVILLLGLTGCAGFYEQPHHDPEMVSYSRDSVRDIFVAQRYNPNATEENRGKVVTGLEGERSRRVLETWREREPDSDALNEDIEYDINPDSSN